MTYFLVWSPLVTTCVMCAVRQEKSPARYKSLSVYLSPVTCASPEWWKIFQLHCLKPATDGFTKLVRLTLVWAPDTCVECCHPGSDTRWLETGDTGQVTGAGDRGQRIEGGESCNCYSDHEKRQEQDLLPCLAKMTSPWVCNLSLLGRRRPDYSNCQALFLACRPESSTSTLTLQVLRTLLQLCFSLFCW